MGAVRLRATTASSIANNAGKLFSSQSVCGLNSPGNKIEAYARQQHKDTTDGNPFAQKDVVMMPGPVLKAQNKDGHWTGKNRECVVVAQWRHDEGRSCTQAADGHSAPFAQSAPLAGRSRPGIEPAPNIARSLTCFPHCPAKPSPEDLGALCRCAKKRGWNGCKPTVVALRSRFVLRRGSPGMAEVPNRIAGRCWPAPVG